MNTRELLPRANDRLEKAPAAGKIVLIYAGITTALAVVTTFILYLLDLQINKNGGLSGMGTRGILSAIRSMLPLVQSVVLMCLALGYRAAMLRVARGQYVSPQTLRLGFDRFWVLLRTSILKGLILLTIALGTTYLATMLFVLTPLSGDAIEILTPLVSDLTTLSPDLVLDEAVKAQLVTAMAPMMILYPILLALFAIPIFLRYRMTDYVIIDKPGITAFAALRESRSMMRYNCLKLLGLDFRLWWYYLALTASSLLCYGDILLPLVGVNLPMSPTAASYAFYAAYLAAQFAIFYFLCNRVEVTYALAYEELRPHEEEQTGVVLGNIFHM